MRRIPSKGTISSPAHLPFYGAEWRVEVTAKDQAMLLGAAALARILQG